MTTLICSLPAAIALVVFTLSSPATLAAPGPGGGHGGGISGSHGGNHGGGYSGNHGGGDSGNHGGGYSGSHGGGYYGGGHRAGYYRGGYGGGYYRGGYGGHRGYWGPGPFWGGLGIGLGVGAVVYNGGYYGGYDGPYYGDTYDSYGGSPEVVVVPAQEGRVIRSWQPVPQVARAAEPIFYPKNGQSATLLENDRRDCNRWATTQPNAMADASIFQRATYACMEGRGYTVR